MVSIECLNVPVRGSKIYLVSDLDEQDEDNKDKHVVDDTDYSNNAVDDLEHKTREVARLRRRRGGDVIADVTRRRRVLHHCDESSQASASAAFY